MTSIDTMTTSTPDFADVYAQHLERVWRFVRSRVPDHHEAHDVTSDVFVRAWRSWDRYDASRGPVAPWLFTIAHRAVNDWWRRRRPEPVDGQAHTLVDATSPEDATLQRELLARLAAALDGLTEQERDGLALRFAARLSMAHVAEVLGTSVGASKMMLHRAIRRLQVEGLPATAGVEHADLESIIDDVLARGRGVGRDEALESLLLHAVALHEPDVPEDLAGHVADCVQCAALDEVVPADGDTSGETRSRLASGFATLLAFAGVCLVCALPALQTLTFALGMGIAMYYLHLVALAVVPLVAWLIRRGVRRHGAGRGWRVARVGAVVLVVHALLHVTFEVLADVTVTTWVEALGTVAWIATDWVGTGLLVGGAFLNLIDTQRWRRAQASGLRALTA